MKYFGKPKENGEIEVMTLTAVLDDKELRGRVVEILDNQGLPTASNQEHRDANRELWAFLVNLKKLWGWIIYGLIGSITALAGSVLWSRLSNGVDGVL